MSSVVAVTRVAASVREAVAEAMELAGWRSFVPEGSRVALKPNLCWDLPLPGAQTSPWVLDAVIGVLEPHVADIVVVEAGQVTVDATKALAACGLDVVLRRRGIPFVDMSRGVFLPAEVPDARVLRHLEVPEALRDGVLVTLPVLKTHATAGITGALKNQWGCLPEMRHQHHLVLDDAIPDLHAALRPAFAVMDGTIGLEGSGPKTGRPRAADLVLASGDLVALDATAARVMGFDPAAVGHVREAAARGLGTADAESIELRGLPALPGLAFAPARPGIIPRTERALRRSRLRRLAFETRALSLLAFAARAYNAGWYALAGRRLRARVLRETRYGAQWRGEAEPASGAER